MKNINKIKKSLLAGMATGIASVLLSTGVFAQTTITVNTALNVSAGSNYHTIAAAVAYTNGLNINSWPTGGYIISVSSGHTESTTTGISVTRGSSAKPLQILKSGTGTNPVITYTATNAVAGDYVLYINAANSIINGIDITGNASTEFGISLTAASTASAYTVKNSKITMNRTNTASVGLYTTASGSNKNSSCLFEYITVENANTGISLNGVSSGKEDLNSIIRFCTIGGTATNDIGNGAVAASGIFLKNQSGINVSNNIIRNVTATSTNQAAGLNIGENVISGTFANNIIHSINGNTSGSTPTAGILISSAGTGNKLYFNSVSLTGTRLTSGTASAVSAALHITGGTGYDITNNIFSNTQTNSDVNNTANAFAFYSGVTNTAFTTINNNDYYVNSTEGILGFLGSNRNSLLDLQNATGKDANSISVNPFFNSATDLQTSNCLLKEKGTALSITTDAYSNTRTSTPSIGAYDMPSMSRPGTWVGVTSTDWATASNWCSESVPSTSVDVSIDSRYGNMPTITSGTALAKNINIGSSASLTLNGGTLDYAGTLTNNGTFTVTSGTLALSGNDPVLPVTSITNLTITKAVSISSNLTVNGALTLSGGGILTTGANKVVLSATGSLVENATSYVLGTVEAQRTVGNSQETFGNIGVSITAAGSAPGVTTVTRINGDGGIVTKGTHEGIKRTYDISAAVNTGLNATLVFSYLDDELNGLTESTLVLYKSTDNGQTWNEILSTPDQSANTLTASGVNGFSRWTSGSSLTPLPVNLVDFTVARKNETAVSLNWNTLGEINNDRFEIERSKDGINFITVGTVFGNGTTTEEKAYNFEDQITSATNPVLYYRLKQVDHNGAFEYSDIKKLVSTVAIADMKAWYNQTEEKVQLSTISNTAGAVTISVIDIQGRVVAQQNTQLTKGSNAVNLHLQNMPKGIYTLVVTSQEGIVNVNKIMKY